MFSTKNQIKDPYITFWEAFGLLLQHRISIDNVKVKCRTMLEKRVFTKMRVGTFEPWWLSWNHEFAFFLLQGFTPAKQFSCPKNSKTPLMKKVPNEPIVALILPFSSYDVLCSLFPALYVWFRFSLSLLLIKILSRKCVKPKLLWRFLKFSITIHFDRLVISFYLKYSN